MKFYIAGGMRGYEHWNFPAFDKARDLLLSLGHEAISPADMDREFMGFEGLPPEGVAFEGDEFFRSAMLRDYCALTEVDAIAFLPRWETSQGAGLERTFGLRTGLEFWRFNNDITEVTPEIIVGFSGYARSGKDTAASALVDIGFQRIGWADSLKAMLLAIDPIVDIAHDPRQRALKVRRLSEIRDEYRNLDDSEFFEMAKVTFPEIRPLLQRLGTEGGRQCLADDIWVRTVLESKHAQYLTIPDCRFDNEAAAVRARGGIIVEIERPGIVGANSHVSENVVQGDVKILNNGSVEDLKNAVKNVVSELFA